MISPQSGMHLAHAYLTIETVERPHAAISLGQPGRAQRHVAHATGCLLRTAGVGFIHSSGDCWSRDASPGRVAM
jgi:hypothetical protein